MKTDQVAPVQNNSKQYDFIIVGSGVAGLDLAYRLVNSTLGERSILIIDRIEKNKNDRTLSFWSDEPTPYDEIVYRSWNQITFASDDFEKKIDLGDYAYKTIRGIDFYQFVQDKLEACPNVEFLQARVTDIVDGKDGAFVTAGEQTYFGQWVFDSRLKPYELKHEPEFGKQVLRQYFKGWIINTAEPAFDPKSATLFDFRVPQSEDMRFFYVLPYSDHEALIEYVGLKHTDYDELMQNYVENTLKLKDYTVAPVEGGAIVLTDRKFKRRAGKHVLLIGSAGGLVKPSSGYAFTRILKDSQAIVKSLEKHGHPFHLPGINFFYRFLDSQMLEVMNRFTGKMKIIFTGLFKYNPATRIFRLLDESTSLVEIVALVFTMPFKQLFIWTVLTDQKRPSAIRPGQKY